MRFMRHHASLVAALALAWHVAAIVVVSTALSCDPGTASATDHANVSIHHSMGSHHDVPAQGHDGMPGHEGMPECPMQRQTAPVCLKHGSEHGTHDCDCPTIGCAQTDTGLTALFGAVGIIGAPAEIPAPLEFAAVTLNLSTATRSLAHAPLSPPPRS